MGAAAGDLSTLANLKTYLGLTQAGDDPLLQRLLSAGSKGIQNWLNRTIASAAYTDTRNGTGHRTLLLSNYPVTAVTSVTVDTIVIPQATSPLVAGWLFDQFGLYLNGYSFTKGFQNVVVVYTAGYAAVPTDLEEACIEWVANKYKEKDRLGQVSKNLAGEIVTFSIKDIPPATRVVLESYRKRILLA
jgi:hypothetical protein